MRLIDADKIIFDYSGLGRIPPNDGYAIAKYFADQIKAMPSITPQPNAPLTLDELREMDGEPVWVVELNGYPPHWGLVYWCRKSKRNIVYVTINNGASICAEAFLTVGGKIYRRRPEERMT